MEELKCKHPLLRRLGGNLVKEKILEEALNHSSMNNLEGKQYNLMYQEGPHSIATIVAWKGISRWIVEKG